MSRHLRQMCDTEAGFGLAVIVHSSTHFAHAHCSEMRMEPTPPSRKVPEIPPPDVIHTRTRLCANASPSRASLVPMAPIQVPLRPRPWRWHCRFDTTCVLAHSRDSDVTDKRSQRLHRKSLSVPFHAQATMPHLPFLSTCCYRGLWGCVQMFTRSHHLRPRWLRPQSSSSSVRTPCHLLATTPSRVLVFVRVPMFPLRISGRSRDRVRTCLPCHQHRPLHHECCHR